MSLIFGMWLVTAVAGGPYLWHQVAADQQPDAAAQAAESITAAALTQEADRWTGDTAGSSDVRASAQRLNARAMSLAEQFRALGLQPVKRGGSQAADAWILHYPIPGQLRFDYAKSSVKIFQTLGGETGRPIVAEHGRDLSKVTSMDFVTAVQFADEVGAPIVGELVPISFHSALIAGSSRVLLLAGPETPASLQALDLKDKVVVYAPSTTADSATKRQVIALLYEMSRGVLVVTDQDSAAFARHLGAAPRPPLSVVEGYMRSATANRWPWAVVLRAAELPGIWRALGIDAAELFAASAPIIRELPLTEAWLYPVVDSLAGLVTGADVIGILEGSDSVLKSEQVVISAPLDAPGSAALLALARALSQPGARPRRSIIFAATSGAAPDFAGTWFFANPLLQRYYQKLRNRVAALALGPLDALRGDSLAIDGGGDFTFGIAPVWIGAMHPELGWHVVDGGTAFRPGTVASAFTRSGLPTLALRAADGATPAGRPTPRAAERMASALRLAFYVAREVANADGPIRWTETGRAQYVDPLAVEP